MYDKFKINVTKPISRAVLQVGGIILMRHISLFFLISLLCHNVFSANEKLYVFYPTIFRPGEVQEEMQAVFGEVAVTVFGRFKDFKQRLKSDAPDALLAKTDFIQALGEYKVALKGLRNGNENAKYVIMSINKLLHPDSISAETVLGVIDVFGRKGMKAWVDDIFPTKPKIKRVTKVEDLLPLLRFNLVNGVLIEDVFVEYFKSTSQLELAVTPILETGEIIALGIKEGADTKKSINLLKDANKLLKSFFLVDVWK